MNINEIPSRELAFDCDKINIYTNTSFFGRLTAEQLCRLAKENT
jgi:hypothetical protein